MLLLHLAVVEEMIESAPTAMDHDGGLKGYIVEKKLFSISDLISLIVLLLKQYKTVPRSEDVKRSGI